MKLIAAGQRIKQDEMFVVGKLWASGYVMADNGADIINAFILIPLPSATWGRSFMHDRDAWMQHALLWTRTRGWHLTQFEPA